MNRLGRRNQRVVNNYKWKPPNTIPQAYCLECSHKMPTPISLDKYIEKTVCTNKDCNMFGKPVTNWMTE